MFTSLSFHEAKRVTASTYEDLASAPLNITIHAKSGDNGEITIHTYDKALSLALVAAINKVDEDRQPKMAEAKLVDALNAAPIDDPALLDDTEPF